MGEIASERTDEAFSIERRYGFHDLFDTWTVATYSGVHVGLPRLHMSKSTAQEEATYSQRALNVRDSIPRGR